ncbi:MAG: superoxide dismutase [Alphaproteobacteria bacterium]|nr:superoxide dismutase [Alphaproteobacteria bacterium]
MSFELPPLPYAQDALEPHISRQTLEYHHGKHHKAYVDNLNKLVVGTAYEHEESLETIIQKTAQNEKEVGIFNNAAQVWNHSFFWHSMKPRGGGRPSGTMLRRLEQDFGSYEAFAELFQKEGLAQFGSGWVWLVESAGKLAVVRTANAANPSIKGQKPLLTCDVWEHAYYLDYQNRRPDFLKVFLENLADWDFAEKNLAAA